MMEVGFINPEMVRRDQHNMQTRAEFYAAFRAFSGQEDLSAKRRDGLHTINLAERVIEIAAKTTPVAPDTPEKQAAYYILAAFAAAGEQHTSFWGRQQRASRTYESLRRLQADALLTDDKSVATQQLLTRPETTAWVKLVNDQLSRR